MSANRDVTIEGMSGGLPGVGPLGLNTNAAVDFSGAPTTALAANATVGGSAITALGDAVGTSTHVLSAAATGPSNYGFQVDESASNAMTGIKITAAASGSGVAIAGLGGAAGEDLTIDSLNSGATGRLKLNNKNGADVVIGSTTGMADFTLAEIAAGTGASAVAKANVGAAVGGPATAAQDGWMKVKIAGTAVFIPVWK